MTNKQEVIKAFRKAHIDGKYLLSQGKMNRERREKQREYERERD
jgi:hypothetical protein